MLRILSSKKSMLSMTLISIFILLISSLSAYSFAAWYQNPDKVVTDTVANMIVAKSYKAGGDIKLDIADGMSMSVSFGTNMSGVDNMYMNADTSIEYMDNVYEMSGGYMYSPDGDIYFKVSNMEGIIEEIKAELDFMMTDDMETAIDNLYNRINDQWIKIGADDLEMYSPESSDIQVCIEKALNDAVSDQKIVQEMSDLYGSHKFIDIDKELGLENGQYGYEISLNQAKLVKFVDELDSTALYQKMKDCDQSFEINSEMLGLGATQGDSYSDVKLQIWTDMWTHKLSRVKMDASTFDQSISMTMDLSMDYSANVSVSAPDDFTTLTELNEYITQFMYEANGMLMPVFDSSLSA